MRLDFGPLDGKVRVTARASGQDVGDRVDIRVLKAGVPVAASWAGIPPATNLPAALEVTVTYRRAVISNLFQLSVFAPGQATQVIRSTADGRVFRWTLAPGTYDLSVMYRDVVTVEKGVPGVQLAGGRTTNITVTLDDLLGTLQTHVVAGGRDVTADSRVTAAGRDGQIEFPYTAGARQALVTPGVYAVTAVYRDSESDMYETYVKPGEITDLTLEVRLPGLIAIVPTIEGKPMRTDKLRAWASLDGVSVGTARVQCDRVELVVPEGRIRGIEVVGGATVERILEVSSR